jgi:hypothetical protein
MTLLYFPNKLLDYLDSTPDIEKVERVVMIKATRNRRFDLHIERR